MTEYEACPACAEYRASNDFNMALRCRTCKGQGIRPNPASDVCNKCGKTTRMGAYPSGLIRAEVSGGYDSEHLSDDTSYKFSLCEHCLRYLFGDFVIPPTVKDCISGGVLAYSEDEEMYFRSIWQKTDGPLEKLARGLCNYDEDCNAVAKWRIFCNGTLMDQAVCDEHRKNSPANYLFVPAEAENLCAIPTEPESWSISDTLVLCKVWANATSMSDDKATYSRFMPDCFQKLTGLSEETHCLWHPLPWWVQHCRQTANGDKARPGHLFTSGYMCYGSNSELFPETGVVGEMKCFPQWVIAAKTLHNISDSEYNDIADWVK